MDTEWKDLVGLRVLVSTGGCFLREGMVNKVSPSGDYVKFNGVWYLTYDIVLKEVLTSGKAV